MVWSAIAVHRGPHPGRQPDHERQHEGEQPELEARPEEPTDIFGDRLSRPQRETEIPTKYSEDVSPPLLPRWSVESQLVLELAILRPGRILPEEHRDGITWHRTRRNERDGHDPNEYGNGECESAENEAPHQG